MNKIQNVQSLPPNWSDGAIVHIYKNKEDIQDCSSYRPICMVQITYKILPPLITQRLTRIIHTPTSNTQYGYKSNQPAIDTIGKIEAHIDQKSDKNHILLMDLSKAFGAINRTLLWAKLFTKGIPLEMIVRIRRGSRRIQLKEKVRCEYGNMVANIAGVFRWPAISALLFIIYLGDTMDDYASQHLRTPIPTMHTQERAPGGTEQEIHDRIRQEYANCRPTSTEARVENMPRKLHEYKKEHGAANTIKKTHTRALSTLRQQVQTYALQPTQRKTGK